MDRYTMFIDRNIQHSKDVSSPQIDKQVYVIPIKKPNKFVCLFFVDKQLHKFIPNLFGKA